MIRLILLFSILIIGLPNKGHAVEYSFCATPESSPQCSIAFQKLRTLINKKSGKIFFDDDIHFNRDGSLFLYPSYYVAAVDIDMDRYNEVIVTVPDMVERMPEAYCYKGHLCPHYILQDRNIPGETPTLEHIKAFGPFFTSGIGLSTDEVFGGFRSLRVYTDAQRTIFDVYQYDQKTDTYYNISQQ